MYSCVSWRLLTCDVAGLLDLSRIDDACVQQYSRICASLLAIRKVFPLVIEILWIHDDEVSARSGETRAALTRFTQVADRGEVGAEFRLLGVQGADLLLRTWKPQPNCAAFKAGIPKHNPR